VDAPVNVVYGILLNRDGLAYRRDLEQGPNGPRLRTAAWTTSSLHVRSVQPREILVDYAHDGRRLGKVVDLQLVGTNLWCIAEVGDDVRPAVAVRVGDQTVGVETAFYFSATRDSRIDDTDVVIRSVALTTRSARVTAAPVVFRRGTANEAAFRSTDSFERKLLQRAVQAQRTRHGGPLIVHDPGRTAKLEGRSASDPVALQAMEDELWDRKRPYGPLRWRPSVITRVS